NLGGRTGTIYDPVRSPWAPFTWTKMPAKYRDESALYPFTATRQNPGRNAMSRFGGLSERRPSVFKTKQKAWYSFIDPMLGGDERQSRPRAAPVNRTPDLWCGSTIH
ncbi:hypothetical protein TNCV_4278641, partial [Trichonephila clavipes]